MRLQSSAIQRQIMDRTGIDTVEDLMYADLRRAGWDKADAFYAAYRHLYSGYKINEQKRIMNQLENDPNIKRRMNGTEGKAIPLSELAKETSKEKILSDLVMARKRMREGTKEWAETTKMIADYAKIKQDEIKTDDKPIRYFLPVNYPTSCKNCLIFQNRERNGKEKLDGGK